MVSDSKAHYKRQSEASTSIKRREFPRDGSFQKKTWRQQRGIGVSRSCGGDRQDDPRAQPEGRSSVPLDCSVGVPTQAAKCPTSGSRGRPERWHTTAPRTGSKKDGRKENVPPVLETRLACTRATNQRPLPGNPSRGV